MFLNVFYISVQLRICLLSSEDHKLGSWLQVEMVKALRFNQLYRPRMAKAPRLSGDDPVQNPYFSRFRHL